MKDSEPMCTVVVSLAPDDPVPLLLLGIRDEFTGRPWRRPARYWPGSPLIGGLDKQASGSWLVVHPGVPRVGCILNGRGEFAPPDRRRSRGELPLIPQVGTNLTSLARWCSSNCRIHPERCKNGRSLTGSSG